MSDQNRTTIYDCGGYGCGHQPCICDPPKTREEFLTRRVAERGAEIERLRAENVLLKGRLAFWIGSETVEGLVTGLRRV